MERISTGNPELDRILHGGLPKNSINVVMGLPGSGKTILAEQLAFANCREQRPVLYLTTLSEPLAKVIAYLQEFSFADVERVGSHVIYDSLVDVLQAGTERLSEHMRGLIQSHRPRVIIIDSFKAIAELVPPAAWRRTVFDLAGLLTAYDTTSLWVGEYGAKAASVGLVEFAVADGILELHREQTGSRDDRYLRVAKLRGSGFLDGKHSFTISPDGLRVFPRLVSPPAAAQYQPLGERLLTGISGLDEMIESGWLRGTSTLLAGPSGAGKTTVALHFLRQGAAQDEPSLLVNFQENPTQIRRSMQSFGWDADDLLTPNKLDVMYTSPVELHIDSIVNEILGRIDRNGVERVAIDALADVERSARDQQRFMDYLYALNQIFAARNITAMLVLETAVGTAPWTGDTGQQISYMSDNVLLLSMELEQELSRGVRVIKSRASAHDGRRHVLRITPQGVVVQ
jgi:circadian clock protein KaiC